MACQQLRFTRGCTLSWTFFVVLLMLDVLALKGYCLTNADSDYSYYSYDVSSITKGSVEDLSNRSLTPSTASSLLRRRSRPDVFLLLVVNAPSVNVTNSTTCASSTATVPVDAVERTEPGKNVSSVQSSNPDKESPARDVIWPKTRNETKAPESTTANNSDVGKSSTNEINVNKTVSRNEITKIGEDTDIDYESTVITNETIGKQLWVDVDNHPDVKVHETSIHSDRIVVPVKLKFDFPFYGRKVRNITISTRGCLYTGDYTHSWLLALQYIAPFMADFDVTFLRDSFVKYVDNGTAFTVEWHKVVLRNRPYLGPFTFQATLHQNGDIVFVYSVIPSGLENIEDTEYPVRIGLSDAYIMERTVFLVRRKVVHQLHRVNFNKQDIHDWTVIYLRAYPGCLKLGTCKDNEGKLSASIEPSHQAEKRGLLAHGDFSDFSYDAPSKTRSPADLSNSLLDQSFERALPRRRRTPETDLTITSNVQQQQQPVIHTNPKVPSVNVTYSTDDGSNSPTTSAFSTVATTPADVPVGTVDQAKPGRNMSFVVSQPMNPAAGLPPRGIIWANRTMSKNVTDQPQDETKAPESTTVENSDIDDISIGKFSTNKFDMNKTLTQNKITKVEEDTHLYYNSTIITNETIGKQLWVDMDNHPDIKVNDLLSQSHRRAATVKLKFDFPFYGHKVRNITIATGGFLYTGEYVHSWLAATQYIAPLMANFDTRLSNESFVKYADNGTAFTVEWDKVILQDKPNAGPFTFQATLHQNGDIVFVYSVIPLVVEDIQDTAHPVKVGLSDAYIMDRTAFFIRRKTIYEYHRVNFNRQDIQNWTVIYLRALPTCLEMDNCNDCLTRPTGFDCKWCPKLNMCSTGTFRHRQNWLKNDCDVNSIVHESSCPARTTAKTYEDHVDTQDRQSDEELSANVEPTQQANKRGSLDHGARNNIDMGVSGIIGILIVIALFGGLGAWGAYAYRNPHSTSGQMLIRYRPSQWSWRRGEARYTAATIHM